MESTIKSDVFGKLFLPVAIKIEAKKQGEEWFLRYEETMEGLEEELDKAFKRTADLAKKIAGVNIERKGNTISYEITGEMSVIAGVIVGEFIQFTSMAKLTFLDMFLLAGVAIGFLKQNKEG